GSSCTRGDRRARDRGGSLRGTALARVRRRLATATRVVTRATVFHVLVGRGMRVRVLVGLGVLVQPLTLGVTAAEEQAVRRGVLRLRRVLIRGGVVGRRRLG